MTNAVAGLSGRFVAALFFAWIILAALLARPIWDIDVWWHLANGEYILKHRTFPSDDPFSFTGAGSVSPDRKMIFCYSWLSQVIMALIHRLGGDYGIIFTRSLLLAAMPLIPLFLARLRGMNWLHILPFALPGAALVFHYTTDRPQLVTFLFFTLLILLLSLSITSSDGKRGYSTAPALFILVLMPLWANMHPGYLMASVVMLVFIAVEGADLMLLRKNEDKRPFFRLAGLLITSIALAGLNPIGYKYYYYYWSFQGANLQQVTSEYLSPFVLTRTSPFMLLSYWLYLVLLLTVIAFRGKKQDPAPLCVLLLVAAVSLTSFRYLPCLVLGTAPLLAVYAAPVWGDMPRPAIYIFRAISVIPFLLIVPAGIPALQSSLKKPVDSDRLPVQAAQFIHDAHPAGNIFNHFNWGGYLMWKLYPDHKVFIDGRAISSQAFDEYTRVLWDSGSWRQILDRRGVNVVIFPGIHYFTGELYALVNFMNDSPEWYLVYRDSTAMVFARGDGNAELVRRYGIPKQEIIRHLVARGENLRAGGMSTRHLWNSLAIAYRASGDVMRAEDAAARASGTTR